MVYFFFSPCFRFGHLDGKIAMGASRNGTHECYRWPGLFDEFWRNWCCSIRNWRMFARAHCTWTNERTYVSNSMLNACMHVCGATSKNGCHWTMPIMSLSIRRVDTVWVSHAANTHSSLYKRVKRLINGGFPQVHGLAHCRGQRICIYGQHWLGFYYQTHSHVQQTINISMSLSVIAKAHNVGSCNKFTKYGLISCKDVYLNWLTDSSIAFLLPVEIYKYCARKIGKWSKSSILRRFSIL